MDKLSKHNNKGQQVIKINLKVILVLTDKKFLLRYELEIKGKNPDMIEWETVLKST